MVPVDSLVLISRPLEQSIEFKTLLGVPSRCIISPVLAIEYLEPTFDPDTYGAFVFTSRNGVIAASRLCDLNGRRAFAVGQRTAELAESFGMQASHADAGSKSMLDLIKSSNPDGPLLFVRGAFSTGDVKRTLGSIGIRTDEAIAYQQVRKSLSESTKLAISKANRIITPVFSPLSAQFLGEELSRIAGHSTIHLIALSKQIANAWNGPKPETVCVLKNPDLSRMVEKTLQHLTANT